MPLKPWQATGAARRPRSSCGGQCGPPYGTRMKTYSPFGVIIDPPAPKWARHGGLARRKPVDPPMHDVSMAEFRTYGFLQMTQSCEIPGADGRTEFHFKPAERAVSCLDDQIHFSSGVRTEMGKSQIPGRPCHRFAHFRDHEGFEICPSKIDWDSSDRASSPISTQAMPVSFGPRLPRPTQKYHRVFSQCFKQLACDFTLKHG